MTKEARRLNDAFAFSILHHRPFVTLKAALSVDGKLAPPPSGRTTQTPHWLTGESARADVQQLRHHADAILTGIGTVLADNPSLTDRTGLPRRRKLLRIILDADLRTPLHSQLVTTADNDLLIVCHTFAPAEREAALRARGAEVLRLAGESCRTSPHDLLEHLHKADISSLLLEGGSQVNGAFLSRGLVDRAILYYSETELGTDAVPFAIAPGPSPYVLQQQLTQTERRTFPHGESEDIRITGYLHVPWTGIDTLTPNP